MKVMGRVGWSWTMAAAVICFGLAVEGRAGPKPWVNSLGMRFVPVEGTEVLFSVWETRVQDYSAFARATGRNWERPSFAQSGTHPVVNVNWEDAMFFCRWLTERERRTGKIAERDLYRLPTSAEWSVAVGGGTGADGLGMADYPWGDEWPPPARAGNYGEKLGVDTFRYTSPVGSFRPNRFGLYDMGGNVREWCMDLFSDSVNLRVLRDASWRMNSPADLRSDSVLGNSSDIRLESYGFRVVLERGAATAMEEDAQRVSRTESP